MTKRFFEYPNTGDTAAHRARGVGPASDYACPIGTVIDAPFAGQLARRDTTDGGLGLQLTGDEFILIVGHLKERVNPGAVQWRQPIALSGNTGLVSPRPTKAQPWLGAHAHAWIIVRATGQRISFQEWLDRYVNGKQTAAPAPAPAAPSLVGRELDLTVSWFWYRKDTDAANMHNARGGNRGGGTMLSGPYKIRKVGAGGSLLVRSNANGDVWLHSSAVRHLK